MIDAHPPIFSAVLLEHKNDTMLDLARRLVKDEHAHVDAMIDYILFDEPRHIPPRPPMPHSDGFGKMYSLDKHSEEL